MKNGSSEGINRNILTLAGHVEGLSSQITKINKNFTILKSSWAIYTINMVFSTKCTLAGFSVNTNFLKYEEVSSFVSSVFATNLTISSKQSKFPETVCLYGGYPWLLVVLVFWAVSEGTGVENISAFCPHAPGSSRHPKLLQAVAQEKVFNLPCRLN